MCVCVCVCASPAARVLKHVDNNNYVVLMDERGKAGRGGVLHPRVHSVLFDRKCTRYIDDRGFVPLINLAHSSIASFRPTLSGVRDYGLYPIYTWLGCLHGQSSIDAEKRKEITKKSDEWKACA